MMCRNSPHFFSEPSEEHAGVGVTRPLMCLEMRCQNSVLEGEDS